MKKFFQILFVIFISLTVFSCSEKSSAISDLESFATELKDHSENYDMNDWLKAEKKYNDIIGRLEKCENDLTQEEKEKVNELNIECAGYFAAGMQNLSKKGLNAIGDIMESASDIFDTANDMVDDVDEVTNMLDDLLN